MLRLDRPDERSLVLDDPDAAISVGPFPLLLDEWQHTPEVLGAVKRAVDADGRPGRFIITSARLDRKTAAGYHEILSVLRLIDDTPAWRSNRLKRLTATPKRYLTDAGLAAWLAGVDFDAARHNPDARGRIIDTYVAAQLRAEAEASSRPVQLHHLRSQRGEHEIDLVAEFGFRVAAFEVKTGSAPTHKDARHIAWLRDQLPPEQFAGGVVFHTGRHRRQIGEGIEAVPIAALWG